jgi:two-component system OmpR family response regulator
MSEQPRNIDAAQRIQLLLVDDNHDFKISIQKYLSHRGVRIKLAGCCLDALDILEDSPIDVVIMDMQMPEIDGIECLRKIKMQWPLIEVLILTGYASVQSGIAGMEAGAFDYCLKPIDPYELVEKVELAAQKALLNQHSKELKEL